MKKCVNCKNPIDDKAVICPTCGASQKKKKKLPVWAIVLIVIIVIIVFGAAVGGGDDSSESDKKTETVNGDVESKDEVKAEDTDSQEKKNEDAEKEITYTPVSVTEMMDMLDNNALKAESTYQDAYVEITGRLSVIDSNGKYISLVPVDNEYAIIGVQCQIKNDEQKARVMDMSIGDTVVLRGKIASVGEVMGYSLDIQSIQ